MYAGNGRIYICSLGTFDVRSKNVTNRRKYIRSLATFDILSYMQREVEEGRGEGP